MQPQAIQLWAQIESRVIRLNDSSLAASVSKVKTELFGRFRPLQDEIVRDARQGKLSTLPIDRYLATSVAALDSTIELVDGINLAADNFTKDFLDRTRKQMLLALAGIAAILLLSGFVVFLMSRRLTRPLNEIMGRIDVLFRGQSGTSFPHQRVSDRDELA